MTTAAQKVAKAEAARQKEAARQAAALAKEAARAKAEALRMQEEELGDYNEYKKNLAALDSLKQRTQRSAEKNIPQYSKKHTQDETQREIDRQNKLIQQYEDRYNNYQTYVHDRFGDKYDKYQAPQGVKARSSPHKKELDFIMTSNYSRPKDINRAKQQFQAWNGEVPTEAELSNLAKKYGIDYTPPPPPLTAAQKAEAAAKEAAETEKARIQAINEAYHNMFSGPNAPVVQSNYDNPIYRPPTISQPQPQPQPQPYTSQITTPSSLPTSSAPSPQANYEGEFTSYGFDRPLLDYLNNQQRLSTFDAGISYSYDPATQTFTGGTRGSGPFKKTLQEMQAESRKTPLMPFKKGGLIKAKTTKSTSKPTSKVKSSKASSRGDGIAQRGKTRGTMR